MTASMTCYIQNDMYYLRLKVIQAKYADTFENDEINLTGNGALISRITHSKQLISKRTRRSASETGSPISHNPVL